MSRGIFQRLCAKNIKVRRKVRTCMILKTQLFEKNSKTNVHIFFAGFLGADVADLATGSLRFPREKGGKLDVEENKVDSQEKKGHKRGSSM